MPVYAADKLLVRYTTPLGAHSMTFWKVTGASTTAFVTGVREICGDMVKCCFTNSSFYTADYQVAGENFSNPIAWAPLVQTTTGITPTVNDTAGEYVNFCGRSSTTGKKVRYFLFGTPFGPGTNMRLNLSASTLIEAVYAEFLTRNGVIGAIDGTPVVMKAYVNLGINDYWTRKVRN